MPECLPECLPSQSRAESYPVRLIVILTIALYVRQVPSNYPDRNSGDRDLLGNLSFHGEKVIGLLPHGPDEGYCG